MRYRPVFAAVGHVLRTVALVYLLPVLAALALGETREVAIYVATGFVTAVVGQVMLWAAGTSMEGIRRIEGCAIVSFTWLFLALSGAVPYWAHGFSSFDGYFESMSGFTTTGATILRDFAPLPRSLLFWRSLTQWLGGLGMVVAFVAIFPAFSIAGRQMFFAESTGPTDDQLTPRIRRTAAELYKVYLIFTFAEIIVLWALGMPLFDAMCNSLSSLAAGGFSPHPLSIMGYHSPAVEWVVVAAMFISGTNFALWYHVFRGRVAPLFRDEELRFYVYLFLGMTVFLFVALVVNGEMKVDEQTLRLSAFQVITYMSTAGFATADFAQWPNAAQVVLIAAMFTGGSAGSAGGGPKIVRMLLLGRYVWATIRKARDPRLVVPVRLNGRMVGDDVLAQVVAFFVLYLAIFAFGGLAVGYIENDLTVGLSGSIATLGNSGPGLGSIGPMGHFADLTNLSKFIFIFEMWVGRLEVVTVLMLFGGTVMPQWQRKLM